MFSDTPQVWLEAGGYFGDGSESGLKKTEALTEGMSHMGYAAVNLGERELLFGWDRLQQQIEKATFPFISANVVYQDSGKPLLDPSVIQTVEIPRPDGKPRKLRIGFLGLARMNPGLSLETPDGKRIVISDPVPAAQDAIGKLRKKSDLVVLLTTQEPDQAKALAGEVPGIDLILGTFGALLRINVEIPGEDPARPTRMLYAGNQGRRLGEVRVFLGDGREPVKMDSQMVTLAGYIPDDPEVAEIVDKFKPPAPARGKQPAKEESGVIIAAQEEASYVQGEACKRCHQEAYRLWTETKHAQAFKILEDRHQDYNPECVRCHVTGYKRPGGFVSASSTPGLKNIQCEACHGPGNIHPRPVGAGYGKVGLDTCRVCHTGDNSPSFEATAYMHRIRHWKTEESPAAAGGSGR